VVFFSILSRFEHHRATQDEPPRVTLIDFGLSKALLEEGDEEAFPLLATSVGKTFVGTPCYLAPEIEAKTGVPSCGGAFTPSTRLVSIRGGDGWFLFLF